MTLRSAATEFIAAGRGRGSGHCDRIATAVPNLCTKLCTAIDACFG
jgi:hypothetical protein